MAKIKIYKPSGLQKQGKQIDTINQNDDFEARKATQSKLMQQQGSTRIKSKDVVIFEQEPTERGLE